MDKSSCSIGGLARNTAVKIATIRFYEQIGLMPQARRTDGAWRVYDEAAVQRLRFIKHARDLGFSVDDVRALLAIADAPDRPCGQADEIARAQLAAVERKIAQLRRLKDELRRMVDVCENSAASGCRVIDALADGGIPGKLETPRPPTLAQKKSLAAAQETELRIPNKQA